MKFDITALGEILIDFAPVGQDAFGDTIFARKAGGAPLNLLATVAKYGGKAAFIGKVGDDIFGSFLRDTVKGCGICDTALKTDQQHNTTLAFVQLDESGDRSFSFYRKQNADVFLEKADIDEQLIESSRLFHFGSLSLTSEPAAAATEYALSVAKNAGCTVTYDPNYRPPLWESEEAARAAMKKHMDKVDILKIGKDELCLLYGDDETAAINTLLQIGIKIILVTDGANGAAYYMRGGSKKLPAASVKPIDTTGAGDIFFGAFLSEWLKNGSTLQNITPQQVEKYLEKAIKISGMSTEKHGAIASIPDERNV